MAQSASIAKLSIRHEAILQYLLANPIVTMGEVAEKFGVTQSWLSVVMNSEAFLEARERYQEIAFHETVLPVREKLMVAANRALDRLNQLTPMEMDLDKVRKTAETTLAALGFGSPKGPSTVNNTQINIGGNASAEVLARARDRIGVPNESVRRLQLPNPRHELDTGTSELVEEQGSLLDYTDNDDLHRVASVAGAEIRESRGAGEGSRRDSRGSGPSQGSVESGEQIPDGPDEGPTSGLNCEPSREAERPSDSPMPNSPERLQERFTPPVAGLKITVHGSGW